MSADPIVQAPSRRLSEPALARCFAISTKQSNHLHAAASQLSSSRRYEFFLACYAAMRTLDDLVDVEFLGQSPVDRATLRPRMLERLTAWESQVTAAERGDYEPGPEDLEALVFTALNELLSASNLGTAPFLRLSMSLRRDLEERHIEDWPDLLEYTEGAAVAPGAIFLYLLAAEEDSDGQLHYPEAAGILDEARDLAHYCYLTHIARDLAIDASQNAQLLTIPGSWLEEEGFTRESFRRAAAEEDRSVAPIARRLLDEGEKSGERARTRLAGFSAQLNVAHREILDYLFALYRDAHARTAERWR